MSKLGLVVVIMYGTLLLLGLGVLILDLRGMGVVCGLLGGWGSTMLVTYLYLRRYSVRRNPYF